MSQEEAVIPKCVGIIMDGNRRWAKEQGLPTLEGHRAGYQKLKDFLKWNDELGVKCVMVYAFSSENWKRDPSEVSYLMDLFREALRSVEELNDRGSFRVLGDTSRLPEDVQEMVKEVEARTAGKEGLTLALAISYGGRDEILRAVKSMVKEKISGEEVTEESFAAHLSTHGLPDPDMIIRTSGEQRLSGFLPWQSVYSEFFFPKTHWPALSKEEFLNMIETYGKRHRRFGA